MNLKKSAHIPLKKNCSNKWLDQSGFSLAELMVAVGIIALMAAIAVPSVLSNLPALRLRTAARELYADMQRAQMAAVKTNTDVTAAITSGCPGGSYTFVDGNGVTVANVTMRNNICLDDNSTGLPPLDLGFGPDGTPKSGGDCIVIKLTNPTALGTHTYKVSQSVAGAIFIKIEN